MYNSKALLPKESKLAPKYKVADAVLGDEPVDLRTMDTDIIVKKLERQMEVREAAFEKKLKELVK